MASGRRGRPWKEPTHEDPKDIMGMFQAMAIDMREQVAVANRMMGRLEQQGEEG